MVATLVLFGVAEPDLILQAFFNRTAAGGVFGNEAEASVCIYGNNNRDDQIALICGSCVELLGELYDINTVLTQCRTYWRSRGSLACQESVI